MYQIVPTRLLVVAVAWVAVSFVLLLGASTSLGPLAEARYVIVAIDVLLFLLTLKIVWRYLWRLIPGLNHWFPDLNGEYAVELHHNWPIQQRMLEAAAGGEPFDPRLPQTKKPAFGVTHVRASIDLSFYWVRIKMWAASPNDNGTIIDSSHTLAANLIRAHDGQPNRIAYIYQQKNRRDRQAVTDDTVFEGAALLSILDTNGEVLRGEYWTNRAWQQGLSTAGQIIFKKRSK